LGAVVVRLVRAGAQAGAICAGLFVRQDDLNSVGWVMSESSARIAWTAQAPPTSCAAMYAGTDDGAMPAKGLAKLAELVKK
jgi:hypothetical protein